MSLLAQPILLTWGGKMKKVTILVVLIFLLGYMLSANEAWSIEIDIGLTGNWSETVNASDIVGGFTGNDLTDTYESATDQVSLGISETTSDPWTVYISRSDVDWPSAFLFSIRRTSDNAGITGGVPRLTYLEITDTNQPFFNGSGNITDILIQYQLSGVSAATILAGTYSITIYYTVTED